MRVPTACIVKRDAATSFAKVIDDPNIHGPAMINSRFSTSVQHLQ
jgi:hypothetical protein